VYFRLCRHSSFLYPLQRRFSACIAITLLLGGCAVGPDYVRPDIPLPAAYKEQTRAWVPATPQLVDVDNAWWSVYGDSFLDRLVQQADTANQDIQAAQARYRQARAAAQFARAGYAPVLDAGVSSGRDRSRSGNGISTATNHVAALQASWEPDLWGRVRRSVEAGEAQARASADDLAAARLSIQAQLVQDYLQLRVIDAERHLLDLTAKAYEKALALVNSQYRAGIAMRSDVALAQTQLQSTQAQSIDLQVQRAQLEHALAFLTGQAPASFGIVPRDDGSLGMQLPNIPPQVPSQLLQRRPDIAAAERRAAAANAQIGVAQAAYFPSVLLTASGGYSSNSFSDWISVPNRIWSLGAALAGTLFDGGARQAQSDSAIAAFDEATALYKRTVLGSFQEVEDNLAALRILDQEKAVQDAAVASAREAERVSLAQYRAGTATYTAVVTAQALSLGNQRSALQLQGRQLIATAALVTALGGGWVDRNPESDPAPVQAAVRSVSEGG
jgi:NodT family efflux transporter outer membrane factor (OMF) lipoprotein